MSLDVYLVAANPGPAGSGIFVREDGRIGEITRAEWDEKFPGREPVTFKEEERDDCFSANITHNLSAMANAAGIFDHLWRPDEIGIKRAEQLIGPLTAGLNKLRSDPSYFKSLNPKNGWGSYEGLCRFVSEYLEACKEYPSSEVRVSR